jgi:hypothetical protein
MYVKRLEIRGNLLYLIRMNKSLGFMLLSLAFVGCTAHMMEMHGDKITIFKVGDYKPGHGGVIRYLNTGMTSWKEARRRDAEKQMKEFCKGPYTITAEGPRSKFGAKMPLESHATLEMDEYTYVAFECSKP